MKRATLLLAIVGSTCFARAGAAQGPVIRLTLDDAITRGLEHSHRVAELRARQAGADAAEAAQAAARLPAVALQGGYTRTNHVDEFGIVQPGGPTRIIYPDIPDNYRARIDLNWPLYSGGRTDALERAAAAEGHAAEEDVAAARADLRLEIARAFWALLSASETEQVLARSLENAAAHVADLRSRFEQGLLPPNDVLSAEAQASRQRVLSIESHNMREIAEADLRRLVGLDGAERVEPAAALDEPEAPAATLDELLSQARKARPELRASAERTAASRAREAAAAATARPQVGVNSGYDYARPNPRIFPRQGSWQDSWDVSVNASWLLWDGGRRRAEIAGAAAASRALEARAADLDRQIAFEVRQRWLGSFGVDTIRDADDSIFRNSTGKHFLLHLL